MVANNGISVRQLYNRTIPEPTIRLEWGEDLSAENRERLKEGETALLYDAEGKTVPLHSS